MHHKQLLRTIIDRSLSSAKQYRPNGMVYANSHDPPSNNETAD
jgi:hypothetical protein